MLAWSTIKASLKKTWVWLKHNWYVPAVIVYTLILWIFFRRKDKALEVLEIRSESYKKQIEAINEIHKEEIEKKDKILEKYGKILKELEEQYEKDSLELSEEKKKDITDNGFLMLIISAFVIALGGYLRSIGFFG